VAFADTLKLISPLGVHQRTKSALLKDPIIREAVFVVLTLGITVPVYFLIRLFTKRPAGRRALVPMSGIAALIAVPSCWLYIVDATWSHSGTFWRAFGYFSAPEIGLSGALVYFVRNQSIRRGTLFFITSSGFL
jgi:hypothetical protein